MTLFQSSADRDEAWAELRKKVEGCTRCGLCSSRKNTVFGQGSRNTPLVFIGEGPGAEEDEQGVAFVGRAGRLLTQILASVGIRREQVFITNVVKCRPPDNRVPAPDEMMACSPFLEAQLALLRPRLVVCLGNTPTKWLLRTSEGITTLRGRWFPWRGALLLPMFHPSFLLRNESRKKGSPKELTWRDINAVREKLGELGASLPEEDENS
ncbi:uracil-DNA glycosylase [Aminivibrio sp.]|jgi:DNA polymerase|uniref:uracil-DNA glycosylase n=1 Tax=Aminivibrio sp. TaxID=1872489 RepID=UPI001A4BD2F9|nr:uracil-DNA glycosylase [Aminivibrio sp.]MBL3538959.1 uracil-DNA glycosylase [Aminivibrio sp.]MDK2958246.1 uracil-DNA glycosylase [Synergistaceae bacterium]